MTFGVFEFDPASGALTRGGRPVALQNQPARMLAALVARPGEIVSREELQRAIWGPETHVDFERGLNFCAAQIRSALGDSATSPRYLETVPRRGYRFIAPVQPAAARPPEPPPAAGASSADANEPDRTPSRAGSGATEPWPTFRRRRRHIVGAAAGILALVAVAAWVLRGGQAARVAVVPFDNETGSPGFDRVAVDLSDAVIARLASPERLSRLRVIGNAVSLRFTFVPRDLKAMGESVGARYILLGQVKRDERRLRVVAHLIRVSDQTHLWARTYDRELLDLAAQSDVAELIAAAVTASVHAD